MFHFKVYYDFVGSYSDITFRDILLCVKIECTKVILSIKH